MKGLVTGQAAKAVAGLVGAAAILLSHFAKSWWEPSALSALTAAAVYLVPNAPAAPPQEPPAQTPEKEPLGM